MYRFARLCLRAPKCPEPHAPHLAISHTTDAGSDLIRRFSLRVGVKIGHVIECVWEKVHLRHTLEERRFRAVDTGSHRSSAARDLLAQFEACFVTRAEIGVPLERGPVGARVLFRAPRPAIDDQGRGGLSR